MKIKKTIMAMTAALVAVVGLAGDSAPFLLDTVTTSTSPLVDSLSVSWDASWIGGDANATVVIADNGAEIGRKTGVGEAEYVFDGTCRHNLTYTTLIGGVEQAEVYTVTVFKDWKYVVADGTATIIGAAQTSGALVIPSEIDGYPVTGIGDGAFYGCGGLKSITMNGDCQTVGGNAFSGVSGACVVHLPYGNATYNVVDGKWQGMTVEYYGQPPAPVITSTNLLHRWSFNGDLTDSVGGQTATLGGDVTTDGTSYITKYGGSGSSYISLGSNVLPRECNEATIEMWVARTDFHNSNSWLRIFEMGDVPDGFSFTGSMYDSNGVTQETVNSIGMCWTSWGMIRVNAKDWEQVDFPTMEANVEYHIAVTYKLNGDRWEVAYYCLNTDGNVIGRYDSSFLNSQWSLAADGRDVFVLGQALTAWDSHEGAKYNEFRIWKKALTEEELVANSLAGPDAVLSSSSGSDDPSVMDDSGVIVTNDDDVAGALAGSSDSRLSKYIKTVTEYNAYRKWVADKGLDDQTVKNSPRAWLSYALDSGGLVERAFQKGDLVADSLNAFDGETCSFEVDIEDVIIGSGATAENLARIFSVEGTSSLGSEAFSADSVNASFGVSSNGKLAISATPKVTHRAFFIRVSMRTDADEGGEGEPVAEPVYATVTYNPGENGIGSQQTDRKTPSVALALKDAIFTRSGYTQTGWATSDGGAKAYDLGASYTEDAVLTLYPFWTADSIADTHDKVQLWEGGPYWATTNIGAENPEDYGYYFWWGDTIGYKRENDAWVASDGSVANFSFGTWNTPTYLKNVDTLLSEGWITADSVLAPEHDAAQVQWGGAWRMPTYQELQDLNSNCDWTWTTMNCVNGYIVRGRGNYASNSIFLPAAGVGYGASFDSSSGAAAEGRFWSSVPGKDKYGAAVLEIHYDSYPDYQYANYGTIDSLNRRGGLSIRPVQGFSE